MPPLCSRLLSASVLLIGVALPLAAQSSSSQIATTSSDAHVASLIWLHAMAVGYSPLYLKENNCGVRYNWPRFPMPAYKGEFLKSAELGNAVTQLLNTEVGVKGVNAGVLRPEMKVIGVSESVGGGEKLVHFGG